jgi:rubrerythrin
MKNYSLENPFNPDLIFPSYKRRTIWNCQVYGQQWAAPLNDVVEGRRVCPFCSGEKAVPGKTSLKSLYPELAKEYYEGNSISSDHLLPSYGGYVLWKCQEYGELYRTRVCEMVDGTAVCPYCSGKKAVQGFNSLKALYPDLIEKEWKFISNILLGSPDGIFPTLASQQYFWKCPKCSTTYKSSPKTRIQNLQRGIESCPSCKGLRQKFINY